MSRVGLSQHNNVQRTQIISLKNTFFRSLLPIRGLGSRFGNLTSLVGVDAGQDDSSGPRKSKSEQPARSRPGKGVRQGVSQR
jgi:hypothetical protein